MWMGSRFSRKFTYEINSAYSWDVISLTSFKYFTQFFPPRNRLSGGSLLMASCVTLSFYFLLVWHRRTFLVWMQPPTSTHLHPGVGFPLWNSRLLFVFFSPKYLNIEPRLLQLDCTRQNVLFSGHQWRMIPTTL